MATWSLTWVKMTSMRFPSLYQRIRTLSAIPESEWLRAETLGTERRYGKRQIFLNPGDSAGRFALVIEGLFRIYRISPDGKELTKAFRTEGDFVGAYAEMLQNLPSRTAVQSLEDSRVLEFSSRDFESLEAGHECWRILGRRVAELHFIYKDEREHELLHYSAEERYRRFMQEFPQVASRLAQHEIASFLGITAVALSRIRGRGRGK